MDTTSTGQAAGSYQERDDLALRSAVGDPGAEPRANSQPQNQETTNSSHSKKSSVNGLKAAQSAAKASPASVSGKQSVSASLPDFILRRNALFDKLMGQHHADILKKQKPEIDVILDLGNDKDGRPRPAMPVAAKAWESTPGSFLRHVDKAVSSDVVIAKVNGKELWDLDRPLEYACRVSYIPFSSPEGRNVFWHSSAHVLGEAAECEFSCLLSHGPPVEQGFFYDMAIDGGYSPLVPSLFQSLISS